MLNKKALAVLNIGGQCIHDKTRNSFLDACLRWNYDFIEIKQHLYKWCHPYWQKVFVRDYLDSYDTVIQLDADMLIRSDAPCPADLLNDYYIAVVTARQYNNMKGVINFRNKAIDYWVKKTQLKSCDDAHHFNAGLMIYNTKKIKSIFNYAKLIGAKNNWYSKMLPEQSVLSILLNHYEIPCLWLDPTWNKTYVNMKAESLIMQNYIYHFTGKNEKERINATEWRV